MYIIQESHAIMCMFIRIIRISKKRYEFREGLKIQIRLLRCIIYLIYCIININM